MLHVTHVLPINLPHDPWSTNINISHNIHIPLSLYLSTVTLSKFPLDIPNYTFLPSTNILIIVNIALSIVSFLDFHLHYWIERWRDFPGDHPRERLTCCGAGITVTSVEGLHRTSRSLIIDFYNASSSGTIRVFCTSSLITETNTLFNILVDWEAIDTPYTPNRFDLYLSTYYAMPYTYGVTLKGCKVSITWSTAHNYHLKHCSKHLPQDTTNK